MRDRREGLSPDKEKIEKLKRSYDHSSSGAGKSKDCSTAVAGVIESGGPTICGGLIVLCCGSRRGSLCIFRARSAANVIVMVNTEHCKWCKSSSTPVEESDFYQVRASAYLRGIFQLKSEDATVLSKLISELMRTHSTGKACSFSSFTGTLPYCTLENVTHISSVALETPILFDKEFVFWVI